MLQKGEDVGLNGVMLSLLSVLKQDRGGRKLLSLKDILTCSIDSKVCSFEKVVHLIAGESTKGISHQG